MKSTAGWQSRRVVACRWTGLRHQRILTGMAETQRGRFPVILVRSAALCIAAEAVGPKTGAKHRHLDKWCLTQESTWLSQVVASQLVHGKLTWLVLGGDPAARSRRVEQFTAL